MSDPRQIRHEIRSIPSSDDKKAQKGQNSFTANTQCSGFFLPAHETFLFLQVDILQRGKMRLALKDLKSHSFSEHQKVVFKQTRYSCAKGVCHSVFGLSELTTAMPDFSSRPQRHEETAMRVRSTYEAALGLDGERTCLRVFFVETSSAYRHCRVISSVGVPILCTDPARSQPRIMR